MNINTNTITSTTARKLDTPNQPNKKEEFKKILDNHELRSKNFLNKTVDKKYNNDENLHKTNDGKHDKEVEKNTTESSTTKELNNSEESNKLKAKTMNFIEKAIDALRQNTEKPSKELEDGHISVEEMAQIQQLLQFMSDLFENDSETPVTKEGEFELNSIKLEQLIGVEKLGSDTKSILKNNLSEIVALLEKSKGNNERPSQILDVLQKLATEVNEEKGDLNLFKLPSFQTVSGNSEDKKDNLLKKVMEQNTNTASEVLPKNAMQSPSNASKDNNFPGNSSSEEKFLNNLLGEDKDEMKISKAVNFMNQFEAIKTLDTAKVQTPNLVIDKSNLQADVIKTIKFMEINNIKDLTVKMNPKELGEITIKITMESGIMKANISAQNKDTYNLLNQNFQDISDKLKSMDIKIQSLDINIYEDSTFFSKDSNERNNSGRQNNNKGTSRGLEEEDISISNNYAVEENQVNKFV